MKGRKRERTNTRQGLGSHWTGGGLTGEGNAYTGCKENAKPGSPGNFCAAALGRGSVLGIAIQ